jgi:hypothetical protein
MTLYTHTNTDAGSRSRSKDTSPKTKRPCLSIQKPIAKPKLLQQQNLSWNLPKNRNHSDTNNHSDNKTYP